MAGGVGIRRKGRGRRGLEVAADINVTSLVDVAFTLLVIFIITAPILQGGVDVRLPQANVQPIEVLENNLILTIQEDGTIFLEESVVTLEDFKSSFESFVDAAGIEQIFIRGDAGSRLGVSLEVVEVAAELGVRASWAVEPRVRRP